MEEGIDISLLYERLSWSPIKRIERHRQALEFAERLREAGKRKREGLIASKKAAGRPKDLRLIPELEALLEIRKSQGSSQPPVVSSQSGGSDAFAGV
ncbi:MAG TPA: hypothetical protein EYP55_10730 [Anaerolineae bacterium]|nr:hypothetical protein [Anaerolineae bacterium]